MWAAHWCHNGAAQPNQHAALQLRSSTLFVLLASMLQGDALHAAQQSAQVMESLHYQVARINHNDATGVSQTGGGKHHFLGPMLICIPICPQNAPAASYSSAGVVSSLAELPA